MAEQEELNTDQLDETENQGSFQPQFDEQQQFNQPAAEPQPQQPGATVPPSLEERLNERLKILYDEKDQMEQEKQKVDEKYETKRRSKIDEIERQIKQEKDHEMQQWNDALKKVEGAIQVLEDELGSN